MGKRILMCGYFGYGNLGDEAVLEEILDDVRQVDRTAETLILSGDPAGTEKRTGCRSENRFHPTAVFRLMKSSDVVIFGGGSLLQDATSRRSLAYYLLLLESAHRMGKKVMLYANGVGPLRGRLGRQMVCRMVETADAVTVRDSQSAALLREIGVRRRIPVTADPASTRRWSGPPDPSARRPYVVLAPRPWENSRRFAGEAAVFCRIMAKNGVETVLTPMMPAEDEAFCREIAGRAGPGARLFSNEKEGLPRLLQLFSGAEAVAAVRLHALIFSACAGTPCAGVEYDPKITGLLRELSMPSLGEYGAFSGGRAAETVLDMLRRRDRLRTVLQWRQRRLRCREQGNREALRDLLLS